MILNIAYIMLNERVRQFFPQMAIVYYAWGPQTDTEETHDKSLTWHKFTLSIQQPQMYQSKKY